MKNEYAVYIGRFQPFHLGHAHVIKEALDYAKHLMIFIGSSNESHTAKNPFTVQERSQVILEWAAAEGVLYNITLHTLADAPTDAEWKNSVISGVRTYTKDSTDVSIIGHDKDASSWYLKAFPQYKVKLVHNYENLNATCLRKSLFVDCCPVAFIKDSIPNSTKEFLINFKVFQSNEFRSLSNSSKLMLKAEVEAEVGAEAEAEAEAVIEYPRIDHTADCIVLGSYESNCEVPYILLIKRKNDPGKGDWALPGGFVEVGETVLESAYRELEEETGITIEELPQEADPTGYVFDHPNRDPRGRVITTAYVLECEEHIDYLNYEAKDDAEEVQWFPLSSKVLEALPLFLDHDYIIERCLEKENIQTIA